MSEEEKLPVGWEKVLLNDFIVKGGGTVDPSKFLAEIFDLYSIPAYDSQKPEVLKGSEIGSTKKIVQENDVLLSRIVPHIQRSWVILSSNGRRQIGSGEWIIFRGTSFIPKYMRYFLLSYDFHRKLMTTISGVGGSLTRANPTQVAQFKIPLPPLQEQHRILAKIEELFSSLDKGIESLKTAKQQLKVYRQAVLKWAFEGKLTNENVKDGELPEGWKWVKINDFLIHPKKGMTTGPFGTALKKDEHKKSGVPVLGIENIGEGIFKFPNKIFVSEEKAVELQSFKVNANDIIISRSGTVGEICCVPEKMENALISTNLIRVRLDQKIISSKYFVYLFQGGVVREQVKELCKGSTRTFLNQTILNSLNFPYCVHHEQERIIQEIETRLSVCDKIEESIEYSLNQAEALRQSILKKAFEGKLVPQDPNDEPASVLLERIREERRAAVTAKTNDAKHKSLTVKKLKDKKENA